jgi:hypothetical protein
MHEVKRWRDDGTNRSREALSVEGLDVLREGHHALGIRYLRYLSAQY